MMESRIWEDYISINSGLEFKNRTLGAVRDYLGQADGSVAWDTTRLPLALATEKDVSPLPMLEDREGCLVMVTIIIIIGRRA